MSTNSPAATKLYDSIGAGYASRRTTDPRIARALGLALGDAATVVNVGAGTGSYEPEDRDVLAVEPSMIMIRQRRADAAPAVQGMAEQLPLRDDAVDAAMAVLTLHHWRDPCAGLAELRRVSRRRVVVLTYDTAAGFWLTDHYLPAIAARDRRIFPGIDAIVRALGGAEVHALPVPIDCIDGFLGAFWARPHAYLDRDIRAGISAFASVPGLDEGLDQLRQDLESGTWHERFGDLCAGSELDVGYRIVVATL
jgi:SAM-dependent methyltransferase